MRHHRPLAGFLGLLLVLGSVACSEPASAQSQQSQTAIPPANFGETFPLAKFQNLNPEFGGASIDLADYVGKKPLVFCYWVAGRSRSEDVLLDLQEMAKELGDKIALLSVVYEVPGREAPLIVERIKEIGVRVPVLTDPDARLGRQLGVQVVPSIALVDAQGKYRLANAVSLAQTVEYKLDVAGVIRRAAESGTIGTHGMLDRYYPVNELVGQKCPDFKAPQVKNGVVRRWYGMLKQDQVNVLVFWSVECGHCKKTMPEIDQWLRQNPGKVNLIGAARVDNDAMKAKTKEFCSYYNFSFPTLVDNERTVAEMYSVTATPTMLVVKPDGTIDSVLISGTVDFRKFFEDKQRELLGG